MILAEFAKEKAVEVRRNELKTASAGSYVVTILEVIERKIWNKTALGVTSLQQMIPENEFLFVREGNMKKARAYDLMMLIIAEVKEKLMDYGYKVNVNLEVKECYPSSIPKESRNIYNSRMITFVKISVDWS